MANTYTLQESFGSRIVVRGAGFLLNNEMTDFNARPGHTDRRGAIGTEANVDRSGQADAQLAIADDRRARRTAATRHWIARRADDSQHRAVRVGQHALDFDMDVARPRSTHRGCTILGFRIE